MHGITRPCRHSMEPEMYQRWMSHLCGLCLTLRDEAGQASRALTGYDLVLLSVLVEAQTGAVETAEAGRCPLRGMRTATVVSSRAPAAQFAAASALLAGSAALEDKVHDRDLPRWLGPVAGRLASAAARTGRGLAGPSGLDGDLFSRGVRRAAMAESGGADLTALLAPSGEVVAELFAHCAVVAERPANRAPLRLAGDAFGRLVHLMDAVEDYRGDVAAGRFNPLAATSTSPDEARRLAFDLLQEVRLGVGAADFVDSSLLENLVGPVLERSIQRRIGKPAPAPRQDAPARGARGGALVAVPAALAVGLGIFGRPGRRRPRYYEDPYGPPPGYRGGYGGGYGYGRRGPSCCDMLACDCCANAACNDCCGGGGDDCCVCCC